MPVARLAYPGPPRAYKRRCSLTVLPTIHPYPQLLSYVLPTRHRRAPPFPTTASQSMPHHLPISALVRTPPLPSPSRTHHSELRHPGRASRHHSGEPLPSPWPLVHGGPVGHHSSSGPWDHGPSSPLLQCRNKSKTHRKFQFCNLVPAASNPYIFWTVAPI
jgi:hypothetical protein